MNYRFADAVYQFFNQPEPVRATQFGQLLTSIHRDYGYEPSLMLQNLLGSHDTARIGSAVVNPTYRQDHQSSPQDNRQYAVRQPTAEEKRRWKQLVAFQFPCLTSARLHLLIGGDGSNGPCVTLFCQAVQFCHHRREAVLQCHSLFRRERRHVAKQL